MARVVSLHNLRGHALDLACGVGQNAIWLARQGLTVDAVDISPVGIERGRASAAQAGVSVNFILADLDVWSPQPDCYDLVIGFRFLNRALWPRLRIALRPGGWLIYQTYNVRKLLHAGNSAAEFPAEYLLALGELQDTFADWRILEAGDDGGQSGDQSWIVCRAMARARPSHGAQNGFTPVTIAHRSSVPGARSVHSHSPDA